jgi:molecular chaperone GrpE (heat shock protein)
MADLDDLGNKIIDETEKEEGQNYPVQESDEITRQELLQILLNTQEQGEMNANLIKNQIEVKDGMIDKLHKELDFYRSDSAGRYVDQVMKSIIKVRKEMKRRIGSADWDRMSADDVRREYQYILEDLTDLLEQQNIDPYETAPGEPFDRSIHSAKVEPTNDMSKDKTIKESIEEGYRKNDKILQPERVAVYQYKQA